MSKMRPPAFTQEEYSNIFSETMDDLCRLLSEQWHNFFLSPFASHIDRLYLLQQQNQMGPVYCTSMSFLNTALACGAPACRIDTYGENWLVYQDPLLTTYTEWPEFRLLWEKMLDKFQAVLTSRNIQKYCSPLQASQAAWKCIGPLLSMAASLLKYQVDGLTETSSYKSLVKGDDFRLEFGEYLDWKIILTAERREVDLFNTPGRNHQFRRFKDKVFDRKRFTQFNLDHCVFQDCEFRDCSFIETSLADSQFKNCRLQNISLEKCQMAGARIVNSTILGSNFSEVIASFEGLKGTSPTNWFRPMSMDHTSLDHVQFTHCFLEDCILEQCTTTFVTISECQTGRSDFAVLESDTWEQQT